MRIDLQASDVNHTISDSAPEAGTTISYTEGSSLWAHLTSNTDADIYVWQGGSKGWVEQSLTGPNAIAHRNLLLVAVSASLVNLRANSLDMGGFVSIGV